MLMKLYTIGMILAVFLLAGCQFLAPVTEDVNETANDTPLEPVENVTLVDEEEVETEQPVQNQTSQNETFSDDIPTRYFREGDVIQVRQDIAYDPDGGEITYTYSAPLDANGRWETRVGDAGTYLVTITASDGRLQSSRQVRLVVEPSNLPPVISGVSDITVDEGETIRLDPVITDPDGDEVTVTYSGFMNSSTRETTFGDAGTYTVTITAADEYHTVSETITVTVNRVNRPPVLAAIPAITVTEGDVVQVNATATDPDGDEVTIAFGLPLDETGSWETERGDAGTYEVEVTASDGELETSRTVQITVQPFNRPPTLQVPAVIEVEETETVSINPIVSDPDGDPLVVTYSGFMTTSSIRTDFGDAGNYTVTVTVTDGFHNVSENVSIIIHPRNRPPVFVGDDFFE